MKTTGKIALFCSPSICLDFAAVDFDQLEVFHDLEVFFDHRSEIKIAAIDIGPDKGDQTDVMIKRLKSVCALVVVQSMDMTEDILLVMRRNDQHDILYVVGGILHTPLAKSRTLHELTHVISCSFPYLNQWKLDCKNQLAPFKQKEYAFDVLYGSPKPHRVYVKNKLQIINEPNWFYQSRFFNHATGDMDFDPNFWEDEVLETRGGPLGYFCYYKGRYQPIQQILPFKVYAKTAYSLVCESQFDNRWSFITEKIAKPMIACRLFIVISCRGYLASLRALGFQTFGNVIDEGYDNEADDEKRWSMALDQAVWLCQQPQIDIMKQIHAVVLHNYEHIRYLKQNISSHEIEKFIIQQQLESLSKPNGTIPEDATR